MDSIRPEPKTGVGMRKIMLLKFFGLREIRLRHHAACGVRAAGDGEERVDAAVGRVAERAVGIDEVWKARFANRAIGREEIRDGVSGAVVGGRDELRIYRRAGAADAGLRMATAATIGIVAGAEAEAGFVGRAAVDGIDSDETREAVFEVGELLREEGGDWRTARASAGIGADARWWTFPELLEVAESSRPPCC